ncbi:MAG: hypothetical protein GKR87_05475 [Kiritimatiellae bacterium]|nr:hypothetical protein [Kiritimatiellia bacterium]
MPLVKSYIRRSYDPLGRLSTYSEKDISSANLNLLVGSETYSYNLSGMMTNVYKLAGLIGENEAYSYSSTHQPHAALGMGPFIYEYDALGRQTNQTENGIQTRSIQYNSQNLIRTVTQSGVKMDMHYVDGSRYSISNQVEHSTFIDEEYQKQVISGATNHFYNVHFGGGLSVRAIYDEVTQQWSLRGNLRDERDSTSVIVNDQDQELDHFTYDPFGLRLSQQSLNFNPKSVVAYADYYHDRDTGLDYARGRFYDPRLRHFLSVDPKKVENLKDCRVTMPPHIMIL